MLSSCSSTRRRSASSPSLRFEPDRPPRSGARQHPLGSGVQRRAAAAALMLLSLVGCSREPIKVDDQENGSDFGATQLNEAVVAAGADRDSPKAFHALAERIE